MHRPPPLAALRGPAAVFRGARCQRGSFGFPLLCGLGQSRSRSGTSPRLAIMVLHNMRKSNKVVPKKQRGRPSTGRDPVTAIRLSAELRLTVDQWAERQEDNPSRSEAIRRLVELGLTVKTKARTKNEGQKRRAREMAGETIDEMADNTANQEAQASRKRRLLKGPEEFQDARIDRSTKK
jgi:hypothetical protein